MAQIQRVRLNPLKYLIPLLISTSIIFTVLGQRLYHFNLLKFQIRVQSRRPFQDDFAVEAIRHETAIRRALISEPRTVLRPLRGNTNVEGVHSHSESHGSVP